MRRYQGAREMPQRRGVKILPLLLALALLLSLPALPGTQAKAAGEAEHNQVGNAGGTLYYKSDGTPADAADHDVTVSKTMRQAKDGSGAALENQFDVDLSVTTKTNYETVKTTGDSAAIVVLDLSSSMNDCCAECGKTKTPTSPMDSWDGLEVHTKKESDGHYCVDLGTYKFMVDPEVSGYNRYNTYKPDNTGTNTCYYCEKPFADHKLQHTFVSRSTTARAVLKDFLKQYAAGVGDAEAYLSIVVYSGTAKIFQIEQGENWANMAGKTDAELDRIVEAANASIAPLDTLTAGALEIVKKQLLTAPPVPIGQCSVVLLTDGEPTSGPYTIPLPSDVPSMYEEEYNEIELWRKANVAKLQRLEWSADQLRDVTNYAFQIRATGAALYTVSFANGIVKDNGKLQEYSYLGDYLGRSATKGFNAGNAVGLEEAFATIVETLTQMRPDTVTDPLPLWLRLDKINGPEVDAHYNKKTHAVTWLLAGATPDSTDGNGVSTYSLSYRVTLNNLHSDLPATGAYHPVNGKKPNFSYYLYSETSGGAPTAISSLYTVQFPVPTVESYSAELAFTKVDPAGNPIVKSGGEAGTFALSIAGTSWTRTQTNDAKGVVKFSGLPSGHSYTLRETKAPAGFSAEQSSRTVVAAWGQITSDLNGGTLKNNFDPVMKPFTVQKKWDTVTTAYQGETVRFTITCTPIGGTGSRAVKRVEGTLTQADATTDPKVWETEVSLPTHDMETGQEMSYTIAETALSGYEASYERSGDTFIIINEAATTRSITVYKEWNDYEPMTPPDIHNTEPDAEPTDDVYTVEPDTAPQRANLHPEVTIVLYNGEDEVVAEKKLAPGDEEVTFTNLPVLNSEGGIIQYRVGEEPLDDYRLSGNTGTMEQGFTLTNTDVRNDKMDVPVHKHWYDDSDALGDRPLSVVVTLQQKVGSGAWEPTGKTLTLTEEEALDGNTDVWAGVFADMPTKVAGEETPITYRVRERDTNEAYDVSYSANGVDINNTLKTVAVTVRKTWIKPDGLPTPNAVFQLLQNGAPYQTYTMVTPETAHTFTDLARKDANGRAYTYTVTEAPVVGYTTDATHAPSFTNKIAPVYDVKVVGKIDWELRGESPEVLPEEVVIRLYANGIPALRPDGSTVERTATEANGWSFEFTGALRYTTSGYGTVAYSVRQLDKDGNPTPDSSTVQFLPAGSDTPVDFGAHYAPVTVSDDGGVFTCNLRNHTDAEAEGTYAVRVSRFYRHYVDGSLERSAQVLGTEENGGYHRSAAPIFLTVHTDDYAGHDDTVYPFAQGTVGLGGADDTPVAEGENHLLIDRADGEYQVNLYYELREKTSGGGGGGGDDRPKPTPTPVPTLPLPTPGVTPSPQPVPPPPLPTPSPDIPTPTEPVAPPPDIRPTRPPLTPDEQDKVDEVIKDVTDNPDHIIKDKDSFEELFPEVSIEDLPPPLYWGPEFAIVEVPVYEEIVAIDSELVPLGNLPQTGTTAAQSHRIAPALALTAACLAAAVLLLWRKREP